MRRPALLLEIQALPKTGGICEVEQTGGMENDYGTGIPLQEVEALVRVLLPETQNFFESEEEQREFAEWKAQQRVKTAEQG